jgi:hypothetical protein
LLGAAAAGVVAGRLTRGVTAVHSAEPSGQSPNAASEANYAAPPIPPASGYPPADMSDYLQTSASYPSTAASGYPVTEPVNYPAAGEHPAPDEYPPPAGGYGTPAGGYSSPPAGGYGVPPAGGYGSPVASDYRTEETP